ncbi:MAG TPA: hypothetical protein VNQ76_09280 [Planctomicrobium sp.]|nr:hypothetical protein [Planctomicrobium sp.]
MLNASADFHIDRAGFKAVYDKADRRFHLRAGAYVRRVAQNSIPVRKKRLTRAERTARVGKPPTSNSRFFKRSILFAYDTVTARTVVGPTGEHKSPSPAAFEFGGNFPFRSRRRNQSPVTRIGQYRRFPTMGPALKNSAPKFPSFWSLRK